MRKITAGLFISLDGVVQDPQDWHFPYFNDEMGAAVDAQLASADRVLLGRKTHDSFAGAWPDREAAGGEDAAMGKALGDARKIVVSNQNLQFTWRNSEQLKGDLVEAVTALKNEPGATDIAMSGSVSSFVSCWTPVSSTNCTCWSTRSPYARACAIRRGRIHYAAAAGLLRGLHHRCFAPHLSPAESTPFGTYEEAKRT